MKKRIIIAGILVLILGVSFTTIRDKDLEIVKNLDIYCTLFRELNMFYVDETDPEKLVTTSINSMLASLDPYTTYIPEKEMDDFNFQTTGEYGGIGSYIRRSGNQTIIAEPHEGYPAAKAGLRAGDVILEIDGKKTEDIPATEVSERLKGTPGTTVNLKISRPYTDQVMDVSLVRENIVISNVPYYGMLNDHTGYIRLSNFTTNAASEVKTAYFDLKKNPGFNKLILDLRSNPGGLLIEAVRTCNLFIDKGELIVSTRGKVKQWDSDYKTTNNPVDTDIPLVILVNHSSASASEIVAGAMQDLDRAVIIGERTFGKGLVQTTRPLKYNAQLKVTTAKYYIPSGRCIQILDYSHRNEDGSVGEIPDSLISTFSTRNGRTVTDGGGIKPDIKVESETYSELFLSLFAKGLFFDYATKFRADHPSIDLPADFHLTDNDYNAFKQFVTSRDFKYETASEQAFQQLVETAKKEKYYSLSEDQFNILQKKLAHNNLKDLETFRKEIQKFLEEEIVARYYYQSGRIRAQITDDNQLDKAVSVLNQPEMVHNILNGEAGALAISKN